MYILSNTTNRSIYEGDLPSCSTLEEINKNSKVQSSSWTVSFFFRNGSSHILFLGFGNSSSLLSLKIVLCCCPTASTSLVALSPRDPALKSPLFSAIFSISPLIVFSVVLVFLGLSGCSLAPAPPPPAAILGADMLGWNLGKPPFALACTIKLVEVERVERLWLAEAPPVALVVSAVSVPKNSCNKYIDNWNISFVGW